MTSRRAIRIRTAAVLLGAAAVFTAAAPVQAAPITSYTLPGDNLFPEGFGWDSSNGNVFVGSLGDGSVVRFNVADASSATVFSAGGADGRSQVLGVRANHGLVYVAGGATGKVWVYDEATGALKAELWDGRTDGLLNDFAFLPDGTAFVTDTLQPILWRIAPDATGALQISEWLDFTGTAFQYVPGQPEADGIVAAPSGRYLVVNSLSTGNLYRVGVADKSVRQIDTGGAELTNADGMDLHSQDLYVARNANGEIVRLTLGPNAGKATVRSRTTNPSWLFPTSAIVTGRRMLVLNSQLNLLFGGGGGSPTLPFTVSSVPRPS